MNKPTPPTAPVTPLKFLGKELYVELEDEKKVFCKKLFRSLEKKYFPNKPSGYLLEYISNNLDKIFFDINDYGYSLDDADFRLKIVFPEEICNPDYNQEMQEYNIEMELYEKEVFKYNQKLEKFEVAKQTARQKELDRARKLLQDAGEL